MQSIHFLLLATLSVAGSLQAQSSALWVSDLDRATLHRLDVAGREPRLSADVLADTRAVALDDLGNAWAISGSRALLQRIDSEGNRLTTCKVDEAPGAVALDRAGWPWVLSPRRGTLKRYDLRGLCRRVIALPRGASDFLIDHRGDLWIASPRTRSVLHYDETGHFLGATRSIRGPARLALSCRGVLFAAELNGRRVFRIDLASGALRSEVKLSARIGAIVCDPLGRAWLTLPKKAALVRLDPADDELATIEIDAGPETLALDLRGGLWVACPLAHTLLRLDLEGRILERRTGLGHACLCGDPAGAHRLAMVDPLGDRDGDGHRNRAEWIAGSAMDDPTDIPARLGVIRLGPDRYRAILDDPRRPVAPYTAWLTLTAFPGTPLAALDGLDQRFLPTSLYDPLFLGSVFEPGLIDAPRGTLDSLGLAQLEITLPLELRPLRVHLAFATLDHERAPNGLRSISAPVLLD